MGPSMYVHLNMLRYKRMHTLIDAQRLTDP